MARQLAPVEKHVIAVYLFRSGWEELDIAILLGVSENRVHKIRRDPRFSGLKNIHLVSQTAATVRHPPRVGTGAAHPSEEPPPGPI